MPPRTVSSPLLPCSVEDEISLRWTIHGAGSLQTTRQLCPTRPRTCKLLPPCPHPQAFANNSSHHPTPITSRPAFLPLNLKPFNPRHRAKNQQHRGWRLPISHALREACCLNQSLLGIPRGVHLPLSRSRSRNAVCELWTLSMPQDTTFISLFLSLQCWHFYCSMRIYLILICDTFSLLLRRLNLHRILWHLCLSVPYESAVMWLHVTEIAELSNICNTKLPSFAYRQLKPKIVAPFNLIQSPKHRPGLSQVSMPKSPKLTAQLPWVSIKGGIKDGWVWFSTASHA